MFKIILKNLWNRRGRYAWLFIELIIVTCLSWFIVDKAVVNIVERSLPLGYDADRLAIVAIHSLAEESPRFNKEADDSLARVADMQRVITKIRSYNGIEDLSVNYIDDHINANMLAINQLKTYTPRDTLSKGVLTMSFNPSDPFFKVYGMVTAPYSPSVDELCSRSYGERDIIVTRSYAERFWPDGDAVGKQFKNYWDWLGDTVYYNVVGVVEDVRYKSVLRAADFAMMPGSPLSPDSKSFEAIVRLKPGISPDDFSREFTSWAAKNLNTGNYYCKSVTAYPQLIADAERDSGVTAEYMLMIVLAAFFLINLVLGVTASFYLQTRRRIEEMGVHRSMGARRSHIVTMLMGEGAVLATVAVIVGIAIFLQYALKYGIAAGNNLNNYFPPINHWMDNFGQHFTLISVIVYLIILACTLIGTYLPARKVSRIEPVDALRDE